MTEPTKEELIEAQALWRKVPKDDAGWRFGFKCGRHHNEEAIRLIAMGLASRPEPYRPTCEVHRDKARDLAADPDSIKDPTARNLARAFRLESDARRTAELECIRLQDEMDAEREQAYLDGRAQGRGERDAAVQRELAAIARSACRVAGIDYDTLQSDAKESNG